jgi:translocator assembly and maintenance protein 41
MSLVPQEVAAHLKTVLQEFPPVQHAFAYGSGVIVQPDLYANSNTKPMLDFIFAVDSPTDWHAENLAHNPKHYSLLGRLGPSAVTWNAERLGAGCHFNTAVWWRGHMIKYGVIGAQLLYDDLQYWDTLYIAGRMQKPVLMLKDYANLPQARRNNLDAAMTMALLLLPEKFTILDLYAKICGVSYIGDVRMGFAEDSRKVERIAQGSAAGLALMYDKRFKGHIAEHAKLLRKPDDTCVQDLSPQSRIELMATLPHGIIQRLASATQAFRFREEAGVGRSVHGRRYALSELRVAEDAQVVS